MPTLPLIDLLILMGSGSLFVGFVLKAVAVTTAYRPSLGGFNAMDFVIVAAICFGLAVTLAARTWVKLNEVRLLGLSRRAELQLRELERENANGESHAPAAVEGLRAGAGSGNSR